MCVKAQPIMRGTGKWSRNPAIGERPVFHATSTTVVGNLLKTNEEGPVRDPRSALAVRRSACGSARQRGAVRAVKRRRSVTRRASKPTNIFHEYHKISVSTENRVEGVQAVTGIPTQCGKQRGRGWAKGWEVYHPPAQSQTSAPICPAQVEAVTQQQAPRGTG